MCCLPCQPVCLKSLTFLCENKHPRLLLVSKESKVFVMMTEYRAFVSIEFETGCVYTFRHRGWSTAKNSKFVDLESL